MPRPRAPRLLLLLPTTTYRTAAFVEAARRLGVDLTVASEIPSTFEAVRPAELLTLDFADPEGAALRVAEFARQYPVAGVAGVDDDTVVVAAAVAARLGLRGNPVSAAVAARDKHEQRLRLAAAGVPVPRFTLERLATDARTAAARAAFPCVLKPLRLAASRGVIRADDEDQFVRALERLRGILAAPDAARCGEPARHVLVEQYVPGTEVAVEGLLEGGDLRVLAIFDKPDPLEGPFFEETIYLTPSRLPPEEQGAAADLVRRAARALGLREGPVHAEVRLNEQGAWLIELAARPIGGRCSAVLRFREPSGAGETISLEEIVIRHALGMALPALERASPAAGVMMIPVPGAGVLREVRGVSRARVVPLVEDVVITAHRGERLVPWPEGSRYPGFIFARGPTPAEVEDALRTAHRALEFVVEAA
ncbi:MAG TPA: ATP-grasp domain-containing protein [Gemmatimonadales bacterium]|nr:ATP-grasp domain-containing protein [Gemmatimonadales bacterium]